MHDVMEFNAAKMVQRAAGAAPVAARQAGDSSRRSRRLVAAQPIIDADISPIVVAGIVRIIEFVLIALIGIVDLFRLRLSATTDRCSTSYYVGTVVRASRRSRVIAFQAADIYHIHAFRRPVSQLRAS